LAAIWQRVRQYGVTEDRYFLLVLALWLAVSTGRFISRRQADTPLLPAPAGRHPAHPGDAVRARADHAVRPVGRLRGVDAEPDRPRPAHPGRAGDARERA